MPLLSIVVALIVVVVALWLINSYVPMASSIKTILNVVVVVAVYSPALMLQPSFPGSGTRGSHSSDDARDSRLIDPRSGRPARYVDVDNPWPTVADPEEVGHNEYDHMGRTLQLGHTWVDETALAELCRRHRVRELSVFGSAARGEIRPDSDIDLLVEFLPDAEVDLIDHAGLMLDLAHLLGRRVDLVSKNGLKPLIRASVLEEARLLYAA